MDEGYTTRVQTAEGPDDRPDVSFVIPARNEADYLRGALASIAGLDTEYATEVIVVDGDSSDETRAIAREYGATVLNEGGKSIAAARNLGAARARGEWLAFVDADTELRANYLTELLGYLEANGLAAGSSYCRITGPLRAKLMEATINCVFSRLERPILPGFNCVVHRRAFDDVGGFPEVPNEDTAFSRLLGRRYPTGYCPAVVVESSGRRIADCGLTGTLWHYARLDVGRLRAGY
ncbi:glycosyl transferase family 2 [Haloterrigena turkmenica DSM 5511]|uniref:Glycosyl transferase family 2 n=1 Tax=Haloterrigena turkmenica (strain ATCC 51198 / DSM 5511 / JCM 9101 / NCIMB 13204 / VKM B-1734 / 4k) TaxID=543526 RepID=D2RZ12_HALTV|nr:glycosyltransferase [Haloterrigena turkmenica]ADB61980.1 glycosyl transferase family 2 [Haloterrigena turkmenica DSM 5511]